MLGRRKNQGEGMGIRYLQVVEHLGESLSRLSGLSLVGGAIRLCPGRSQ